MERNSSRNVIANRATGPQPDSDNVAIGAASTAAGVSRHDSRPKALSSAQANALAKSASAQADDSSQSNGPNVGQDLTDAQKAELGGSGSGTPGGWEPQDEKNARAKQSAEIARQDVEKLGYDTNKVSHIFADKHEVSSLIKEFGSREAALKEMHNAVQHLADNPGTYQTGSWVTVRLGKNYVSVKGIVINGEFKISTATMRSFQC